MAKKIVVVDDSRTVRKELGTLLVGAGYEVIEASDGMDGAEKIAANEDAAMVICDVNMPRMNGIEMLSLLKKDPRYSSLLVIMLTTEGQPRLIAEAKQAGAKGWVVKPFRPELLLATVRKLVGVA